MYELWWEGGREGERVRLDLAALGEAGNGGAHGLGRRRRSFSRWAGSHARVTETDGEPLCRFPPSQRLAYLYDSTRLVRLVDLPAFLGVFAAFLPTAGVLAIFASGNFYVGSSRGRRRGRAGRGEGKRFLQSNFQTSQNVTRCSHWAARGPGAGPEVLGPRPRTPHTTSAGARTLGKLCARSRRLLLFRVCPLVLRRRDTTTGPRRKAPRARAVLHRRGPYCGAWRPEACLRLPATREGPRGSTARAWGAFCAYRLSCLFGAERGDTREKARDVLTSRTISPRCVPSPRSCGGSWAWARAPPGPRPGPEPPSASNGPRCGQL